MKVQLAFLVVALISSSAFADEISDKAMGIKCSEAKDMVKVIAKMTNMKPEQTDTVSANPSMKITPTDGGGLPDRLFFRYEGIETPLTISADGSVPDVIKVGGLNKKGEICVEDKARLHLPKGSGALSVGMDFDVLYKTNSGRHTIEDLKDGLGDGRAHIKKLVPTPFRMMVPKFTHVGIQPISREDEEFAQPAISALQGETKVEGLRIEKLGEAYFVSIKQMEELNADGLSVSGEYEMGPSPSPEKMKEMEEKEKSKDE